MNLFDPQSIPFSMNGSFLAISWLREDQAYWIRSLRGGDENTDLGRLLRIKIQNPKDGFFEPDIQLTTDCLTFGRGEHYVRFVFANRNCILVEGQGLKLVLELGTGKYNYMQIEGPTAHICQARQDMQCNITISIGTASVEGEWDGLTATGAKLGLENHEKPWAAQLDFYRIRPANEVMSTFAETQKQRQSELAKFRKTLPKVAVGFANGNALASYILWMNYVERGGVLTRDAIYMSKNWMTNIWSWDHCFVALAFAEHDPQAAFEQMEVIFNAQDDSGRLPDFINDRFAYWAFTKPPVHGWTFGCLRKAAPAFYTTDRAAKVLKWLSSQVSNWLDGPNYEGLPAIRHGNDGGWDNATQFLSGAAVATPDLATFVILQLEEIATLHGLIGQETEATIAWQRAELILRRLNELLWDGARFRARNTKTGAFVREGDSLLGTIPLLLGDRLPHATRDVLIAALADPQIFLSSHGLVTEALGSPYHTYNGYWRGPIWAPTTMLMVDALDHCGRSDLADEIAQRFCAMANQSGMAENFDPFSGKGLHDPAFAWTSAVFLVLAQRPAMQNT